jgi:hypothetical protein
MSLSGSDDVARFRFYLDRSEAGGVPTASKRLDEQNRSDEALAVDDGSFLFVDEKVLLGINNIEIINEASDVAGSGNVELASRGGNRVGLGFAGGVENLETGYIVLNFAEGIENGVAIAGDVGVVAGLRELQLGSPCAAGENGLGNIGADGPGARLRIKKLRDVSGVPATLAK